MGFNKLKIYPIVGTILPGAVVGGLYQWSSEGFGDRYRLVFNLSKVHIHFIYVAY